MQGGVRVTPTSAARLRNSFDTLGYNATLFPQVQPPVVVIRAPPCVFRS
jgi:hypothetical protein